LASLVDAEAFAELAEETELSANIVCATEADAEAATAAMESSTIFIPHNPRWPVLEQKTSVPARELQAAETQYRAARRRYRKTWW
jgi:hypothetical protein